LLRGLYTLDCLAVHFAGYLFYQFGITLASGGAALATLLNKFALGAKIVAMAGKAISAVKAAIGLIAKGVSAGIAGFVGKFFAKHVDEIGKGARIADDIPKGFNRFFNRMDDIQVGYAKAAKNLKRPGLIGEEGLEFLGKHGKHADDFVDRLKSLNPRNQQKYIDDFVDLEKKLPDIEKSQLKFIDDIPPNQRIPPGGLKRGQYKTKLHGSELGVANEADLVNGVNKVVKHNDAQKILYRQAGEARVGYFVDSGTATSLGFTPRQNGVFVAVNKQGDVVTVFSPELEYIDKFVKAKSNYAIEIP